MAQNPIAPLPGTGVGMVRDGRGVLHLLSQYESGRSETLTHYYARCAGDWCDQVANWKTLLLPTPNGYQATMAVSSTGKVVVMWDSLKGGYDRVGYTECSAEDCTNPAAWSAPTLVQGPAQEAGYILLGHRTLAFDASGTLHLALNAFTGTWYGQTSSSLRHATCSSDCTSGSNWQTTTVASYGGCELAALAVAESSVGIACVAGGGNVNYFGCDSTCTASSSWVAAYGLAKAKVEDGVDLAFFEGAPRVVVADAQGHPLLHGCSVASKTCPPGTPWNAKVFSDTVGVGSRSEGGTGTRRDIAMAVEPSGQTTLAYVVGPGAVKVQVCQSDCASAASSWTSKYVDTRELATAESPGLVSCTPAQGPPFTYSYIDLNVGVWSSGGLLHVFDSAYDLKGCDAVLGATEMNPRVRFLTTRVP